MARRYPQARIDEIRDAYNEWEKQKYVEGAPTAAELAESLGISKPTMYALKARGWSYANEHRPTGDRARIARLEADVQMFLREVTELRDRVESLESQGRNGPTRLR